MINYCENGFDLQSCALLEKVILASFSSSFSPHLSKSYTEAIFRPRPFHAAATVIGVNMINWEELKHIHVIKKLDEVLSSWFNTAILIADGHGIILNHAKGDKPACKNMLMQLNLEMMLYMNL